jgi:hypothetical protein
MLPKGSAGGTSYWVLASLQVAPPFPRLLREGGQRCCQGTEHWVLASRYWVLGTRDSGLATTNYC